jgi:hypothetical protein
VHVVYACQIPVAMVLPVQHEFTLMSTGISDGLLPSARNACHGAAELHDQGIFNYVAAIDKIDRFWIFLAFLVVVWVLAGACICCVWCTGSAYSSATRGRGSKKGERSLETAYSLHRNRAPLEPSTVGGGPYGATGGHGSDGGPQLTQQSYHDMKMNSYGRGAGSGSGHGSQRSAPPPAVISNAPGSTRSTQHHHSGSGGGYGGAPHHVRVDARVGGQHSAFTHAAEPRHARHGSQGSAASGSRAPSHGAQHARHGSQSSAASSRRPREHEMAAMPPQRY